MTWLLILSLAFNVLQMLYQRKQEAAVEKALELAGELERRNHQLRKMLEERL